VRNAGAAENRRKFAHNGTAYRGGGARRKVASEREHSRVVSVADSLKGLERANKDLQSMTGRGGKGSEGSSHSQVLYPKIDVSFRCHTDVTAVTLDERKTLGKSRQQWGTGETHRQSIKVQS